MAGVPARGAWGVVVTLDEQVADAIGVDRTVPQAVAEVMVGRAYRLSDRFVEGAMLRCRNPKGGDAVWVHCPTDGPESMEFADRRDASLARMLAERYPIVAAEITAYRIPPRPYSTDWNALDDVRAWLVAGGFSRVEATERELNVILARRDPGREIYPWLMATPEDFCRAVIAVKGGLDG